MAARKNAKQEQKAVESILKKKNLKYADWKKDVIKKKKLAVLGDEDKEWLEDIVSEASLELIMDEVVSNQKETQNFNNTSTVSN